MDLVSPVHARLVTPAWAPRVVSPLHDALTASERRAALLGNPDSYLHVTSPPLTGASQPVEDGGAQVRALRRLLDEGAYRTFPEPSVFVYRMREDGVEHTGVVAGVDLSGFGDGRVLGHEAVQPARVEGLIDHHARVPMRSELVALFHEQAPEVRELTKRVCHAPAVLEFTDVTGIHQSVWRADPEASTALAKHLSNHRQYIADGHHRVAAALGSPGTHASLLCVLYAQDQVLLHAFHRRVRGPVAVPQLLKGLPSTLEVRNVEEPDLRPGSLGMYAAGRWRALTRAEPRRTGAAGLDVTYLHSRVLLPLLGLDASDARLEFLPGSRSMEPAVRACDEDGGVLFTLPAPRVDDLIAVAEAHEVMSAKTTYVKPKPRSGIFLL